MVRTQPYPQTLDWPKTGATTFSITTLCIMTLSIKTLSIKTLSIIGLFATLGINDIQHNDTQYFVSLC
jgi:hypothetical protein